MKILLQNGPIRNSLIKHTLMGGGRDPSLKYTPGIFITEHFKEL
jgi:hypothetical protein